MKRLMVCTGAVGPLIYSARAVAEPGEKHAIFNAGDRELIVTALGVSIR